MHQVLHDKYSNIGHTEKSLVQTQSQTKYSGIKLPKVHGMRKNLDPNILPEKQHTNPINGSTEKPCIDQGRAGMRRRRPSPINQTIIQPAELSQKIPGATEIETRISNHTNSKAPTHSVNNTNEGISYTRPFIPDAPSYPGPTYINQAKSKEVGDALIENIVTKYSVEEYSTFMSSLMTYLLNKFKIKIRTVVTYSHQSLQAEYGIKILSNILTKHLTNLGKMWPKYLSLATYAFNTINTPNLGNYSPYELTFGRKPKSLLNLETAPDIKVSGSFKDYYDTLNNRLKYLHNLLLNFKSKRLALINKDRAFFQYNI